MALKLLTCTAFNSNKFYQNIFPGKATASSLSKLASTQADDVPGDFNSSSRDSKQKKGFGLQPGKEPKPIRGNKLLIIGLGNPGEEYEYTRHNLGFICLDYIASNWKVEMKMSTKFTADYGANVIGGKSIGFLKPMTFMNLSGGPVKKIMNHFQLQPVDILVIHDEASLDWGEIQLRPEGGSHRGHNGLRDIEKALGTKQYARLAVGMGGNDRIPLVEHVLSKLKPSEKQELDVISNNALKIVENWCK
eukprot:gene6534-13228_t